MKSQWIYRRRYSLPNTGKLFFLQILFLSLSFTESLWAQKQPIALDTLDIGDILPEPFYQHLNRAVTAESGTPFTFKLDEYRDKLIILDFWADWCGPCIRSLIRLDSIVPSGEGDDFIILPVTYQDAKTARAVLKEKEVGLPTIISDTTLHYYLPHWGIPHQVWIKDGKVVAIPMSGLITAEKIKAVARGEEVRLRRSLKNFDPGKPIFVEENGNPATLRYQSTISGGDPAFGEHFFSFENMKSRTVLVGYNRPVLVFFRYAFQLEMHPQLLKTRYYDLNPGMGMLLEVNDTLKARLTEPTPVREGSLSKLEKFLPVFHAWKKKAYYSYSLRLPWKASEEEARLIMQEEINRFFRHHLGIEGAIEMRSKKVAILRPLNSREEAEKLLRTRGGESSLDLSGKGSDYKASSWSIGVLKSVIRKSKSISDKIPIIDSTGISREFELDFRISEGVNGNLALLQKELNRYGLELSVREELVPLLVIREVNEKRTASRARRE